MINAPPGTAIQDLVSLAIMDTPFQPAPASLTLTLLQDIMETPSVENGATPPVFPAQLEPILTHSEYVLPSAINVKPLIPSMALALLAMEDIL